MLKTAAFSHSTVIDKHTHMHAHILLYVFEGNVYFTGVSGCLPPRLRNEVIWNSTANLTGKPGHNIALDLVNEFLNNEFKCKSTCTFTH